MSRNVSKLKNVFYCLVCHRLQRVRQRQEYRTSEGATHPPGTDSSRVTLFSDYAVLDRRNKSYVIGSLVRLVCVGDHGRQEYKRLVAYNDPKKREHHLLFFQVYNPIGGNSFEVTTKLLEFPFKDILTHVNLAICDGGNTLLIPDEELGELKKKRGGGIQPTKKECYIRFRIPPQAWEHEGYAGRDDGRVVV